MAVYKEVPLWWYAAITLASFVMASALQSPLPFCHISNGRAVVCCYTEKSGLPWWALIVALIFAILILPFYGAMYAISAVQLVITNLFQILGAALVPGSSQANMVRARWPTIGHTLTGYAAVL